jgi:hypothetical protein
MDNLSRLGRVWREADAETTDLDAVITDPLDGQYSNPVRVVSFNTAEKWSQDVSADVAEELRRPVTYDSARCRRVFRILSSGTPATPAGD